MQTLRGYKQKTGKRAFATNDVTFAGAAAKIISAE
jgi:hypothetical protein